MRYLPNALTITRILLTPLMLVLLATPTFWGRLGALVLFVVASVSDYLDGELARRMEARSRFGTFLDPMADKVLVLGTFVTLAVIEPQIVPWWAVLLIALRDAVVTGLRSWAESHGKTLRTLTAAKWKTSAQLVFLFLMLLVLTLAEGGTPLHASAQWMLHETPVLFVLLMGVVAFTLYTGALYVMQARTLRWEHARSTKHPR